MGIDGITPDAPDFGAPTGPTSTEGIATHGEKMSKAIEQALKLDPDSKTFVVFGTASCPWCDRTKEFLKALHEHRGDFQVAEVDANAQPQVYRQISAITNCKTVPQIFLDGRFVGGWRELANAARTGQLDAYLDGGDWSPTPAKRRWFRK